MTIIRMKTKDWNDLYSSVCGKNSRLLEKLHVACVEAFFTGIRIGELERALDAAQGHDRDIAEKFFREGREAGFREGLDAACVVATGGRR